MARAKREEEGTPGAPDWIVTFSDMVSLLVTFFVLLMTFSSIQPRELLKVRSILFGREGVIDNLNADDPAPTPEEDILSNSDVLVGEKTPHSRPLDQLPEDVVEMGREATEQDLEIDFSQTTDGLLIVFDEDCAFAPGEARVGAQLRNALARLAEVLENYPFLVVVEGHTDDAFRPTERYPTAGALATARAVAAAEILLESSSLAAEILQVAGIGADRPRVPNDSAMDRRANRRVEVRILSLSRARHEELERRRAREEAR